MRTGRPLRRYCRLFDVILATGNLLWLFFVHHDIHLPFTILW